MNFSTRGSFNFATLFKFQDLSDKTQSHLVRVYTMLVVCSLVCAFGMYVNTAIILSGFFLNLLSIVLSCYFIYQVVNRENLEESRLIYLGALAFQMGFLVGPAMHLLVEIHPQIVVQALLYTGASFTSFSLISLLSKRRSFLFLGSIIVTMMQAMLLYRLFGWLAGY